jgi:hypothetical protein
VNVLVDTCAWSLVLRRRRRDLSPPEELLVKLWEQLAADDDIVIIGTIRQELLTGVKVAETFSTLREALAEFDDEPLQTADFERAAEMANTCRAAGVQGSPGDFLVCAVGERLHVPILTTDADFAQYARLLPIVLHDVPR